MCQEVLNVETVENLGGVAIQEVEFLPRPESAQEKLQFVKPKFSEIFPGAETRVIHVALLPFGRSVSPNLAFGSLVYSCEYIVRRRYESLKTTFEQQ